MTITLKDEGKRIYFAGNTFPAKDAIKAIGGRWDADAKAWWVGAALRAEAVALVTEITMTQDRAAAALPALTGKLVPVPGNTYAARGALRDLGASWDAAAKAWLVDAARLTLATEAVVSAHYANAPVPRAPSPRGRELREQFEQAQAERVAAIKRHDEAQAASTRACDTLFAALHAGADTAEAGKALAEAYAAVQAAERAVSEASTHENLRWAAIKSHEQQEGRRAGRPYVCGW